MSFVPHTPPEAPHSIDEPGFMHIGGARRRRVWHVLGWLLALSVIAGVMVALFVRFGATTLWALGLVIFMLGYMVLMSRWAEK